MSLNKAIESGKEHRKQYTGAKLVDCTCRNHGTCAYCRSNRLHKFQKKQVGKNEIDQMIDETDSE